MPHDTCPRCGSTNITSSGMSDTEIMAWCSDCGKEWIIVVTEGVEDD